MKRLVLILALLPFAASASDDDIFLQGMAPEVEESEKKPVFVVPLQPVWNSADANLLLKVGKNLVTLIEEAGPWKVVFYDETKELKKVQDHEARLHKKWLKEVVYTEALLKHRRAGHATSGAARVTRLQSQNAGYLRTPNLYCRSLMIVAEGRLFMGQVAKAKKTLRRLAGTCERGDLEKSRLTPTKRFKSLLEEARQAAEREASGELTVTVDVPGTDVYLNGRRLGPAPLTLKKIPAGEHLVGVFREGFKPWGKKVQIDPGETVTLQATVTRGMGGQDQQRMLSTLRDNRVDANVARVVGRLFKRHGKKAVMGLFGGVAKQGNQIWVTLYAVDKRGRAIRLKQMKFDPDFLTAHLALSPVMEEIGALAEAFQGSLLSQAILLDGLDAVVSKPRVLGWRVMKEEASEAAGEVVARGPVRRGPVGRGGARAAAAAAPAARIRPPESAPAFAKKPSKQVPTAKPAESKAPPTPTPEELAAELAALDAEEESLAAEMEALAVKEASEATGLSVEQLQRRAERDMRMRIWAAMDPDHVLEFQALGALGLSSASGGALQASYLRRQPTPMLGVWGAFGVEGFVGQLGADWQDRTYFAAMDNPFKQSTRDNPELKERVRVIPGSSFGLRAVGRLGLDLGDGRLRLLGQAGLGYAMHRSSLKHEQYTIDSEGFAVAGSGVAIQDSIVFPWAGPEVSGSVGAAYRLVGTSWRLLGKVQWQQTLLGSVQSFVTGQGAQSTLGLAVGVSGTF